jgi:hypothetical protein
MAVVLFVTACSREVARNVAVTGRGLAGSFVTNHEPKSCCSKGMPRVVTPPNPQIFLDRCRETP